MEEEKKEEVIEEVKEVNEVNEKVNEPVVVPTTVIEPEKKSKKKLIIILSIVGVVLIGIIVALILLLGGKKKYTVTFDTQGGNVIEKVEVEKGATVPRPATPVKEGYTFKGWEYAGTPYYFNIGISSDMTIKATWEEDTSHKEGDIIKVTFVYDNGDSDKVVEVTYGESLKRPDDPVYEGYEFDGWYKEGEDYEYTFYEEVTEEFTLTAKWEKQKDNEYIINFNTDGGSYVELQTVKKGNKVVEPKDPTKTGYKFVEWQLNNQKYDFEKEVTSNLTLKAKWESDITITFDSKGGSSVQSQKVNYGETVTKPADPTKDGYTFVAWLLKDKTYNFEDKVTESFTLEAKWETKGSKVTCSKIETIDTLTIRLDLEATIEDDKVKVISGIYVFDTEANAKLYYDALEGSNDSNLELSGTRLIIKDLDKFSEFEDEEPIKGISRSDFESSLKAEGYTCK